MKAQKCLRKGHTTILALVAEQSSEERKIDDIPIVRDYPEVFPEELPSLPPHCQVEFQIDLAPGAAPIARAPYRLAPSELQEWSTQLHDLLDQEAIKNWATPTTPTEVRQFLGLAGYHRRFIEGFSKIAQPLTTLAQKGKPYNWGDTQESAFQLTKHKLCSTPILSLPEGTYDFVAYCDASIQDLETLLVRYQMHYLHRSQESSTYFEQKELNMRQRRWVKRLNDYDCAIRYHPGKANAIADALSRKDTKPKRVRALQLTIHLGLPDQIRSAQSPERGKPTIVIHAWYGETT
ncbi:hypothetical protein L1987_18559 [Smallanthus sonchifolius]|uniref:Uncharacterized protein n=1 Tax=Smallanthus sonchifolius TaxID=185202 RepID=A0ACB9J0K1_9ASTR|nr:hypothetical protein L1987_18559 [Smallanthus sonchifolius]